MTSRYSLGSLAWHALSGHRRWQPVWRSPQPKANYDVVIIGGGGHGLATAYYLAKRYGVRNVAVVERGWIGGGNSGRNTQVTRSNYFHKASTDFFDHSLKLYESLGPELNFNVMLSQHGVLNTAHSRHEMEVMRRWANAILVNDIDSEMLTPEQIQKMVPAMRMDGRYPVFGGFIQRRGGISRHDAVNWGFARGADALGVDIIQDCEVTAFVRDGDRITSVQTSRGRISADRFCLNVAGHSTQLAEMAGFRLPLISRALQAMVSEPVKPMLDVTLFAPALHIYVSQTDRGEILIGGAVDAYNSYGQRGSFSVTRDVIGAIVELLPSFSRLKLMRQWGGIVDISPDTSPIMGPTPLRNLYVNCGWGTGGYKAIPAGGDTMAHTLAHGSVHPLITAFGLDRFERGALVDEGAAAGVAH